jgi:hypothetical protein
LPSPPLALVLFRVPEVVLSVVVFLVVKLVLLRAAPSD